MIRKNYQKLISRILIAVLIFMSALTYLPNNVNPYMISANAVEVNAKDELALIAIRNNYNSYMSGTAVDAGWGNFSSYDIYLLLDAGVAIDDWSYEGTTLESSVITLIDDSIAKETTGAIVSAKRVAQDYLGAKSIGENEKAATLLNNLVNRQTATGELDEGPYAIYSNMAAYDLLIRSNDLIGAGFDIDKIVEYVLGTQDVTGAWPIEDSVNWITNDFMTTAEALRILYTLKDETTLEKATIETAINNGLTWLKSKQNPDGSFVSGYDDSVTDTSEIIYTAIMVGEDPTTYLSGEGNSPVDYIINNALVEGSFGNVASTTWALDAYLQLGASCLPESILAVYVDIDKDEIFDFETTTCSAKSLNLNGLQQVTTAELWESSDESVATVDNLGKITAKEAGTTTISIDLGGVSDSVQLVVKESSIDFALLTAIRNQYEAYMSGTSVDAGWGNFSSYDIYVLTQTGTDISNWSYNGTTLEDSVLALIDSSISSEATEYKASAKRVAQDYLMALNLSEDIRAAELIGILEDRQLESGEFDTGIYGIYSNAAAFDLLIRANALNDSSFNLDSIVNYLLDNQDATGAWPIEDSANWITNDFMTTAETVRVLNALKNKTSIDTEVIEEAIENGFNWLKTKQNSDGSFVTGYDDKVVDTSEMINTALYLGVEPSTIVSTEGNNPVDFFRESAMVEGSFGNVASTTWAMDAYLQLGVTVSGDFTLTLNINPSSASVKTGKTQQFTAVATKIDGTTDTVSQSTTWSTSDETIATIDNTGLLTGVKSGSVIVTGSYASCTTSAAVTVNTATTVADNEYINVYILVLDENGDTLYGPDDVRITENDTYGETAMGALDATGLDWKFSDDFDGLVVEIEGIKNSGMNGWMYSVNENVPSVLAVDKEVDSSDKIIWWYSTSAMEEAPEWPNSSTPPSSGSASSSPIKDSLEDYSGMLSDETVVINQDNPMTDEELKELREKLDNNTVELNGDFDGSDMIMSDDEISVLVSSGAYSEDITITANELENSEKPRQFAVKLNSGVYEFGPNGTVFDEPIVISINIAIDESVDINKLAPAWYNEETNEWKVIPCIIDVSNGMVTFEIDHFTKFALIESANRVSFDDVTKDIQWAKDYIEILAGQGLLEGTGNGFEPYKSMTRAEFVKLMVEALGYETNAATGTIFSDVSVTDWFAPYVECAAANGIIKGDIDNTFRPNDSVSRYEVAVILNRLGSQLSDHITLSFDDANMIPDWALDGVEYVSYNNIMNGYNNLFSGKRDITRAEAAVVVYRYLTLY